MADTPDIEALIARLENDHADTSECEHGFLLHRDPCPNPTCLARDLREAAQVIRALSGAVEAERERCAKIADQTEPFESEKIGSFESLLAFYYGGECAAAAIRSSVKEE